MKQLVQNIRTGESRVFDVPAPRAARGSVLIRVAASLVSAGTERMVLDFAEKSILEKARSRPDLVRQTIDKARRDGVLATFEAVQNRLNQPMALGYSVAGTVIEVGDEVTRFRVGDRVAAAGAGQAVHAEVVSVPINLVVPIPDSVSFEEAAFTTLGAIALQGIRLADPKLGEVAAVIGVGLLGQIAVQLLRANGCRVIGYDPRQDRADLAILLGAESCVASAEQFRAASAAATGGRGVDCVIIAADSESDEPIALAGEVARERAVVVAVGAVGMNVPRKTYYEKELDLRVSRSYGPGRYDDAYERSGIDYPYAYVRWTENRNMEAFVHFLENGRVDIARLITHRIDIGDAARAYDIIGGKSAESFLGVILQYPQSGAIERRIDLPREARAATAATDVRLGVIGAGNFARSVLLPAFRAAGASMVGIAAATGLSASDAAKRFGFRFCATDDEEIFADPEINAVVVATRHDLHAAQTIRALQAGKHVFVEKPLCLNEEELDHIDAAYQKSTAVMMVGFNRRYAPMSRSIADHFRDVAEPLTIHYRVNAGYVPATAWIQSPREGGGRLIGECVHFIDWAMWMTGDTPESVYAVAADNVSRYTDDNLSITIRFRRGSLFHLLYVASGDRAAGKERIEVHSAGKSAILDDFRRLELVSGGRRRVQRSPLRADKGHRAEAIVFMDAVRRGIRPSSFDEIANTMRSTFAGCESLASHRPVSPGRRSA